MANEEELFVIKQEKLAQIKKQFEKLFSIKGYHTSDNFNANVWFLKENPTFQSYYNSATPISSEPISKRIMDIFCSLNQLNNLKNLRINVGDFIHEISNKIIDANNAITMSKNNIQQNKTLEKIARLNEILQILNHKIESSQGSGNYSSTLRANIHSLKNFPRGQYRVNLLINNQFTREEEREMNGTERKNIQDLDELGNLFEHKKLQTNMILDIPTNDEEVTYRTQKGVYRREGFANEPNSFPEYKFVSMKKEGCKYILDRRYSGSSLSNFKVQLTNGKSKYVTKNEFFFLYVLNYLFDDFCNINKETIAFDCTMKAYDEEISEKRQAPGIVNLEILLDMDNITRAELLNRIREVFSLTVDTKEDNANFIKEILSDYFPDIKEAIENILSIEGDRNDGCCTPSCSIY